MAHVWHAGQLGCTRVETNWLPRTPCPASSPAPGWNSRPRLPPHPPPWQAAPVPSQDPWFDNGGERRQWPGTGRHTPTCRRGRSRGQPPGQAGPEPEQPPAVPTPTARGPPSSRPEGSLRWLLPALCTCGETHAEGWHWAGQAAGLTLAAHPTAGLVPRVPDSWTPWRVSECQQAGFRLALLAADCTLSLTRGDTLAAPQSQVSLRPWLLPCPGAMRRVGLCDTEGSRVPNSR